MRTYASKLFAIFLVPYFYGREQRMHPLVVLMGIWIANLPMDWIGEKKQATSILPITLHFKSFISLYIMLASLNALSSLLQALLYFTTYSVCQTRTISSSVLKLHLRFRMPLPVFRIDSTSPFSEILNLTRTAPPSFQPLTLKSLSDTQSLAWKIANDVTNIPIELPPVNISLRSHRIMDEVMVISTATPRNTE